jgi:putative spermidine/putrescine transport system ATP-binding protein
MQKSARAAELNAEGIGKSFGSFQALKDVSLHIAPGEFLTLLGPSGSGKTTFLMILAGFEQPTTGRLTSNGVDITRQPAEARSAGMVFQGYALFPHMTVEQNIAFPLKVRKRPADDVRRRVGDMIGRVGLKGHGHKLPSQLSGGQQQRGTTFVFVTHDQSEALALSSRVAIFNHGALLQVGAPQEVYDRPSSRFVAEFLGEINLLPLTGVQQDNGAAVGLIDERPVRLAGARVPEMQANGRDALLAVRPEYMSIATEPPAAQNAIAATATASTYLGSATRLDLTTRQGDRLTVSVPNEIAASALGSSNSVWLTWPQDKGFLLPREA